MSDLAAGAADFQPAQRRRLSDEVYRSLRNAILDGDIPPGTRLVELSLARQFETSRAPLREALVALQRDGLVSGEPSRDTRVIELGEQRIRELHLIRGVLETLAYQWAAARITDSEIEEARRITQLMDEAEKRGDFKQVSRLDYNFHRFLAKCSGLEAVVQVLADQHVLIRMWMNTNMAKESPLNLGMGEKHRALLDTVVDGDPRQIGEAVRHHVYLEGAVFVEERRAWLKDQPHLLPPVLTDTVE